MFICVISSSSAIIQVKLHCSVCVFTRTNFLFFWGEWMNYILRNVHQEQCSFPLIVLWGIFTGVTVFCAFWACWNVSSFWGRGGLQNNEPGWTSIQEHITMDGWCMNRTFFFIGFLFPAILTIAEGSKVRVHPTIWPQNRKREWCIHGGWVTPARTMQFLFNHTFCRMFIRCSYELVSPIF